MRDWLMGLLRGTIPPAETPAFRTASEPYAPAPIPDVLRHLGAVDTDTPLHFHPRIPLHLALTTAAFGKGRSAGERLLKGLIADAGAFAVSGGKLLFLIEFDSPGWPRGKRERARRIEQIARSAQIGLARWPVQRGVDQRLASAMVETFATRPLVAPLCPRCGAASLLRTARRGENAGGEFWGCSAHPDCGWTEGL